MMLYPLPKKIQLLSSQAKWSLNTTECVLALVGLDTLHALDGWGESELYLNVRQIINKAKSLEISIIHINQNDVIQGMMLLGEQLSQKKQLIVAGLVSAQTKQLLEYLTSVTEQICIVNDAIYLNSQDEHVQWINSISQQKWHHMNSYSLMRLWSLSAPKDFILSAKGILFAVAEHLDLEPLEIDPTIDLRLLGLDSVAMVELVSLWHVNGAKITYDLFDKNCSIKQLMQCLASEMN